MTSERQARVLRGWSRVWWLQRRRSKVRARARRAVFVWGGIGGWGEGKGGAGWDGVEVVFGEVDEVVGRRKRWRIVHWVITGPEE